MLSKSKIRSIPIPSDNDEQWVPKAQNLQIIYNIY